MLGMNHEHTTWVRKFNKCCGIPIAWRGRKESRASEGLSESLNPKTCTRQTVQKSEGETHVGYRKSLKNYLCRWYWVGQPWSRACGHRKLLEVRGVEVEAGRAILGSPAGADGLKQFFSPESRASRWDLHTLPHFRLYFGADSGTKIFIYLHI